MAEFGLTKSEEVVMKCIWNSEVELALSDVTANVNNDFGKDWKPQTVSTFLARLVRKEYLSFYRKGRYFFYQPLVKEKDYKRDLMKEFIRFWDEGNVSTFIDDLCRQKVLSKKDIKELKEKVEKM